MVQEVTAPASRRALLAAGLGGLAALVAHALGRPDAVRAGTDGDLVLGQANTAHAVTSLSNDTTGTALVVQGSQYGLEAESGVTGLIATGDSGGIIATGIGGPHNSGTGIIATGWSGVVGHCDNKGTGNLSFGDPGTGVTGIGPVGVLGSGTGPYFKNGIWIESAGVTGRGPDKGVRGDSGPGIGMYGTNQTASKPAVLGHSQVNGTGLQGYSGGSAMPGPTPAKVGVYGYAAQDTAARGVVGQSTSGKGVHGLATSGRGVQGDATGGAGLLGTATTGTAVYGQADTNGTALRTTRGHVRFNTAGLATVAAGTSSVTVTPGFDISSTSKILAVLQGNPGGSTILRYVVRDDANNRFTIQLSAIATVNTPVAWFVIS
jgi:hypothetical protein